MTMVFGDFLNNCNILNILHFPLFISLFTKIILNTLIRRYTSCYFTLPTKSEPKHVGDNIIHNNKAHIAYYVYSVRPR